MKLRVGYGQLRNAEVSLCLCSLLVGFSTELSDPDVRGASSPDGLGGEGGGVGGLGRVGIGVGEGGLSESGSKSESDFEFSSFGIVCDWPGSAGGYGDCSIPG